jgi:hypothetical protein
MPPEFLVVFLQYFIPAIIIITLMLNLNAVLKFLLIVVDSFFHSLRRLSLISRIHITKSMKRLISQGFIYFTKGDDIFVLNKVMIYVQEKRNN